MAERAGFEPAIPLRAYTLSKRAPSTTRTPLRVNNVLNVPILLDSRLRGNDEIIAALQNLVPNQINRWDVLRLWLVDSYF